MNWFYGATVSGVVLRGAAIFVACSVLVACSSSPSPNGTTSSAPPIESESPEVQAQFDRAYEFFNDGDWDGALEEFRLLQAEHAGDATADLAELYIARSLMGDVDGYFLDTNNQEGTTQDREVFALLEPLAMSESVDSRIRYAAQAYLATAYALESDVAAGLDLIADYPGASISPAVLEGDRRWVWPLVAEGLADANRFGESVIAWGNLYDLVREDAEAAAATDELGDAAAGGDWMGDVELPAKADLAVARAFDTRASLDDEDIRRFLGHDKPLVRAVGAWTLIRGELEQTPGPERVIALQEVFNERSSDFLLVGAADRASELSVALAAVSGPDRLVIGALLPLSGPNRAVGYRALAGMLIAQRAFHAAGEPAVTLVIEDSHPDVMAGYQRLVEEGALAVVGPLHTGEARQLLDAAQEWGVPLLSLAADRIISAADAAAAEDEESDDGIAKDRAPVFRNFVDAVAEARAAAYLSFEKFGDRRAAVVYPNIGYGRVLAGAFVDEFRRQGGQVVVEEEYDRSTTDFVNTATRVARAEPDAVFLPDTGAKVAEISAFFAQEDIWGVSPEQPRSSDDRIYVHYLGTSLWQDPIVLHQASNYLEGALIPAWYSPYFEDAETRQLSRGFEAIYGAEPDHFAAFAYDSVARLRTYLLERGVPDAAGVTESLRQRQWEAGATGRNYFGDDGEPHRELRYLIVNDGEWAVHGERVHTPIEGRLEAEASLYEEEDLESLDEESVEEVDADAPDGL